MKFYLIHAPIPDLERTQADAKATGHKFEVIERPADHAGIIALVKEMVGKALAAKPQQIVMPAAALDIEQPAPAPRAAPAPAPVKAPAKMHPVVVDIMNGTAAEEYIWKADAERIAKLEAVIAERKLELAAKATGIANPQPRIRRRA